MESELDLILQIDIGARQEAQQGGQIRRDLIPEVGLNQISEGWRRGRSGPCQHNLHP